MKKLFFSKNNCTVFEIFLDGKVFAKSVASTHGTINTNLVRLAFIISKGNYLLLLVFPAAISEEWAVNRKIAKI